MLDGTFDHFSAREEIHNNNSINWKGATANVFVYNFLCHEKQSDKNAFVTTA